VVSAAALTVPTGPSSTIDLFGAFSPGGPTQFDNGGSIRDVLDIRNIVGNAIKPFMPPAPLVASPARLSAEPSGEPVTAAAADTASPIRTTGSSRHSVTTLSGGSRQPRNDEPGQSRAAKRTTHSSD
jgi:hypothetical protein